MELDGQNNAWKKIKSVVNKKKTSMKYPILSTKSADGKITKSITTNEKLEAFHKSLKPTFENNIDPKTFNKTFKNNIDDNVAENIDSFIPVVSPDENNLFITAISPEEINKIIGNLKIKKASGPDKINNKLIRALKSSLSNILSDIFSLSLKHGYIPKAWKQAAVLLIKKPHKVSIKSGKL